MKTFNMYKREKINVRQLRYALRVTHNYVLINLQDLSTVQKINKRKPLTK